MRHRHYKRCPRHIRVWLTIGSTAILLEPFRETFIMANIRLDQTGALSVQAVDVFGNPTPAVIDSVTWSNSNDAAATLAISGNDATLTPVAGAVGQSTTVTANALIGGAAFTATAEFTVTAGAVAGIAIVTTLTPA
jgi:hypothetical protein